MKVLLLKEDHEFPIHYAEQEVRTIAFQNHLQFRGIKLAKKCHIELRKMHKQGSQSGIALCNTFFTNNYHVELPCKRSDG